MVGNTFITVTDLMLSALGLSCCIRLCMCCTDGCSYPTSKVLMQMSSCLPYEQQCLSWMTARLQVGGASYITYCVWCQQVDLMALI